MKTAIFSSKPTLYITNTRPYSKNITALTKALHIEHSINSLCGSTSTPDYLSNTIPSK